MRRIKGIRSIENEMEEDSDSRVEFDVYGDDSYGETNSKSPIDEKESSSGVQRMGMFPPLLFFKNLKLEEEYVEFVNDTAAFIRLLAYYLPFLSVIVCQYYKTVFIDILIQPDGCCGSETEVNMFFKENFHATLAAMFIILLIVMITTLTNFLCFEKGFCCLTKRRRCHRVNRHLVIIFIEFLQCIFHLFLFLFFHVLSIESFLTWKTTITPQFFFDICCFVELFDFLVSRPRFYLVLITTFLKVVLRMTYFVSILSFMDEKFGQDTLYYNRILIVFPLFQIIVLFLMYRINFTSRRLFIHHKSLRIRSLQLLEETHFTSSLVRNILPDIFIPILQSDRKNLPHLDRFSSSFHHIEVNGVVVAADIVQFTRWCRSVSPSTVIYTVNKIFSVFDKLCCKFSFKRSKTAGDSYTCYTEGDEKEEIRKSVVLAIGMVRSISMMLKDEKNRNIDHKKISGIRVGVSAGKFSCVMFGSSRKLRFDIFGATVDRANALEASSETNCVNVDDEIYSQTRSSFSYHRRGMIMILNHQTFDTVEALSEYIHDFDSTEDEDDHDVHVYEPDEQTKPFRTPTKGDLYISALDKYLSSPSSLRTDGDDDRERMFRRRGSIFSPKTSPTLTPSSSPNSSPGSERKRNSRRNSVLDESEEDQEGEGEGEEEKCEEEILEELIDGIPRSKLCYFPCFKPYEEANFLFTRFRLSSAFDTSFLSVVYNFTSIYILFSIYEICKADYRNASNLHIQVFYVCLFVSLIMHTIGSLLFLVRMGCEFCNCGMKWLFSRLAFCCGKRRRRRRRGSKNRKGCVCVMVCLPASFFCFRLYVYLSDFLIRFILCHMMVNEISQVREVMMMFLFTFYLIMFTTSVLDTTGSWIYRASMVLWNLFIFPFLSASNLSQEVNDTLYIGFAMNGVFCFIGLVHIYSAEVRDRKTYTYQQKHQTCISKLKMEKSLNEIYLTSTLPETTYFLLLQSPLLSITGFFEEIHSFVCFITIKPKNEEGVVVINVTPSIFNTTSTSTAPKCISEDLSTQMNDVEEEDDDLSSVNYMNELTHLLLQFDEIVEDYGRCYGVKTIQNTLLIMRRVERNSFKVKHLREILSSLTECVELFNESNLSTQYDRVINIGLGFGVCCSGIVGHLKIIYDIFGPTVNFASRLTSVEMDVDRNGLICVSRDNLVEYCGNSRSLLKKFKFEHPEVVELKGRGYVECSFLKFSKK